MNVMKNFLQYVGMFIEAFIWWRLMGSVLERKYHKYYLVAAAVIMFILTNIKYVIFLAPELSGHQFIGTITLFSYTLAVTMLLFKNSWVEKLVWWGVYNFGMIIMELLTIFMLSSIMKKSLEELSSDDRMNIYIIIFGKILTLLLFEIIIRKHRNQLIIGRSYSKELAAIIILNLLLIIGVVFLLTNKKDIYNNMNYVILFFFGVILLITTYTVALIFRIERKTNEELETKLKMQQMEMELKLNHDMVSVTDRLRRLRHDMNNHIGLIKTLIKTKKYDELEEYIDQIYEDVEVANDLVITENKTLSVLLNSKKSLAREKNINFNSMISAKDINMQNKDLCALLGNILDNAIEAAEKSGEGKYIQLTIQKVQEGCVISCENSLMDKPIIINGKFKSTKDNTQVHGIGIENIKDIVAKYNGDIHFEYDEEIFSVRVAMPV